MAFEVELIYDLPEIVCASGDFVDKLMFSAPQLEEANVEISRN